MFSESIGNKGGDVPASTEHAMYTQYHILHLKRCTVKCTFCGYLVDKKTPVIWTGAF